MKEPVDWKRSEAKFAVDDRLLQVSPVTDTDTSYVEWSSTWNGKDQETAEFCSPIYVALLADLKSKFK